MGRSGIRRGACPRGQRQGSAGFQSLPVNVWETPEGYQAALLAPGLDETVINVTVHDDTLAIEGDLRVSVPENSKPVWQEFGPAKFRRSLRLGSAVDPSRVEAIFRNGLLLVTMPKAEHAKPRQIQVQVGTAASAPATPAAEKRRRTGTRSTKRLRTQTTKRLAPPEDSGGPFFKVIQDTCQPTASPRAMPRPASS